MNFISTKFVQHVSSHLAQIFPLANHISPPFIITFTFILLFYKDVTKHSMMFQVKQKYNWCGFDVSSLLTYRLIFLFIFFDACAQKYQLLSKEEELF